MEEKNEFQIPVMITPGDVNTNQPYWGSGIDHSGAASYSGNIYQAPLYTKENIMDEVSRLHYRISDIQAQIERLIGVVAGMNKIEKGERRKLPEVKKK